LSSSENKKKKELLPYSSSKPASSPLIVTIEDLQTKLAKKLESLKEAQGKFPKGEMISDIDDESLERLYCKGCSNWVRKETWAWHLQILHALTGERAAIDPLEREAIYS
jgi:hypothetical protein